MTDGLQYLSLARKAGLAELGEEPVGSVTRAGKGALVLVASDASEHTWRRAMSFVAGTKQTCIRIPATKAEMGQAIGRQELAIAAITDPNMALAMVKALPGDRTEALEALNQKADRQKKHRQEEKAHARNVRKSGGHTKK